MTQTQGEEPNEKELRARARQSLLKAIPDASPDSAMRYAFAYVALQQGKLPGEIPSVRS
jgi:hypothetical protein